MTPRLLLAVLMLCLLSATTIVSRPPAWGVKGTTTIPKLQSATLRKDTCYVVTDAVTDGDCTLPGGGSIINICCSNGTSWQPIGDGAGAGSYDLDFAGDSGTGQILDGDTMTFTGGIGITTAADGAFDMDISVTANSIDQVQLSGTIDLADGDEFNLSAINPDAADEGLILPQTGTCGGAPNVGSICYGSTLDELCVFDGTTHDCVSLSGAGTGDITDVGPGCDEGACWTDGVATTGTILLNWEGTAVDANDFEIIVPSNPGAQITITMPIATATLVADNTAVTSVDGAGLSITTGTLNTQSTEAFFIKSGTIPPANDGALVIDTDGDGVNILNDTLSFQLGGASEDYFIAAAREYPTVLNSCLVLNTTDDDLEWSSVSCIAGGGGDSITVEAAAATDPNFLDTAVINVTLDTGASPDTIKWDVQDDSLDFTELSNAMTMDGAMTITGASADTLQWRFDGAWFGDRFTLEQLTGDVTAGALLVIDAVDTDVTLLAMADGKFQISQEGVMQIGPGSGGAVGEIDLEVLTGLHGNMRLGNDPTTGGTGTDCDNAAEEGRIVYDANTDSGTVLVCLGAGGWKDIDDDGGAGGGDDITVQNGFANPVDPIFNQTTTIAPVGTDAAPDTVTWDVRPDSLDFTEFEDTLDIEPGSGSGDPDIQTINIGDNERFLFAAVDTGSTGALDNPFAITLQWDENVDAADSHLGVSITSTNDNTFADSGVTTVMQIATIDTANDGQYVNLLHLDHRVMLADTLVSALSITGNTASSMDFAIDLSGASVDIGAINLGQNKLYASGALNIGDNTDTSQIDFSSAGGGQFVRFVGNVITGIVTSARGTERNVADCTTETGGATNELCIDTTSGAGTGMWRCPSPGDCNGTTAWERVDDTAGGGAGDVTDVGPGCATGACWTDGLATTGTSMWVWEGTVTNTDEFTFTVPSDPDFDVTWVLTQPTVARTMTFPDAGGEFSLLGQTIALTTETTGNYAAGDAEAGAALTGDSATAFFSSGEVADAQISNTLTHTGGTISLEVANMVTGIADDELMMGNGVDDAAFIAMPDCVGSNKIRYTASTNTFTCVVDETGGTPAWEAVTDPGGDQTLAMAEFETTFNHTKNDDVANHNPWRITYNFTGATSSNFQDVFTIQRLDSGGAHGDIDSLLTLTNADINDAVDTGIFFSSQPSGMPIGIDLTDADIDTALAIGSNDITTTSSTIAATELDLLDTMTAKTGADFSFVTGTAGGTGLCAEWNVDGDLVEAASAAACGSGGSGDNVSVNSTGADTTANFLDGDIDWTLVDGGAGGPDDITATVECSGCISSADIAADTINWIDIDDTMNMDAFTTINMSEVTLELDASITNTLANIATFVIDVNIVDDGDGTDNVTMMRLELINESIDAGDTAAMLVLNVENSVADAGQINSMIRLTVTDFDDAVEVGLLINGGTDDMTIGIDVSDNVIKDAAIAIGANAISTAATTIQSTELDRLDGLVGIIATDATALTNLDGDGLAIAGGQLNTASDAANFLELLTVPPVANGSLLIDTNGDGTNILNDTLIFQAGGEDFFLAAAREYPTVDNSCLVLNAANDDWEWSATSCTAAGATNWDNIGDPAGPEDIVMADHAQSMTWDSLVTAVGHTHFEFAFFHDATTDATSQVGVEIRRFPTSGTATFETLLGIDNDDTDGLVVDGIRIRAAAGGMTTAVNASDAEIVAALAIGSNTITTTAGTITSVELDRLTGLAGVIATDTTAITNLDGNGLQISGGALLTSSSSLQFLFLGTTPPSNNGALIIDESGDGTNILNDTLIFQNGGEDFFIPAAREYPTVNNSCLVLNAANDDWEWSATSCTAAGATNWDNIGDPGGSNNIGMATFSQIMDWDSGATGTALNGLRFGFIHDATSDSAFQIGITVERVSSTGTQLFETLLLIDNKDTDGLVTSGIEISSDTGNMTNGIIFTPTGVITTAINAADADIVTALAIGSNTITTTAGTITSVELDRLTGLAGIIATDATSITDLDGFGLDIVAGSLRTDSAEPFLLLGVTAPINEGALTIDTNGDSTNILNDTLQFQSGSEDYFVAAAREYPTVLNSCLVLNTTNDDLEWSSTSCIAAGSANWEDLANSADTATAYVSNNTAETVTFSFESAFGASQQFLIRQQTGNPTAGTLLDVRAADANVTVARFGDGTNGITIDQNGVMTTEGTGSYGDVNLDFVGGTASPTLSFVPNASTTFTIQASNAGQLQIRANTGATEGVDFRNTGAGVMDVFMEGDLSVEGLLDCPIINSDDQGLFGCTPSLTSGGLLFGNGPGNVGALAVATNGQLPIGDGAGAPTLAVITGGTGITITNGAGTINVVVDVADSFVWTGTHDFGGGVAVEIVNGTNPNMAATGRIAVDTTDLPVTDGRAQFLYNEGGTTAVLTAVKTACFDIEDLVAGDDDFAVWSPPYAVTILGGYCYCNGTCTVAGTVHFEKNRAGVITQIGGATTTGDIACSNSSSATEALTDLTAGTLTLASFDQLRFDTITAPTATNTMNICWTYTIDRQ